MQRFHQLVFVASLVTLSWFAMMAVHEAGHVFGAVVTGGSIERVVLYPLSISRTDVTPNPRPGLVVWLGPILGCLIPAVVWQAVPRRVTFLRRMALFFAGFCLIANGAYIAVGSFDQVGDCGEMLRTGSPQWVLIAFGVATVLCGLFQWHSLGSLRHFLSKPEAIPPRSTYVVLCASLVVIVAGFVFSPR